MKEPLLALLWAFFAAAKVHIILQLRLAAMILLG